MQWGTGATSQKEDLGGLDCKNRGANAVGLKLEARQVGPSPDS